MDRYPRPTFDLAERGRRWQAVRRNMAAAGLDALLTHDTADVRYLTQRAGGGWAIVAPGGEVTLVSRSEGGLGPAEWVSDARTGTRWATEPVLGRLRELPLDRGRIGVSGLNAAGLFSQVRSYEGTANYGTVANIMAAYPNATFVDATDVIGEARFVKSEAEVEFLRHATEIGEAAVDAMVEHARPGVVEGEVFAHIAFEMDRRFSESYSIAWYAGPIEEELERIMVPTPRVLQRDWYITNEFTGIYGGYNAQAVQPLFLGRIPDIYRDLFDLQRECYERCLSSMKPGLTFGELRDVCEGVGRGRTSTTGEPLRTRITLHGRGLGDDGPLFTSRASGAEVLGRPLQAGNTFVFKPYGETADGKKSINFGDVVVVREDGAHRLGVRPHEFISVE